MKVFVTDHEGVVHPLAAEAGIPLMEIIMNAGISIAAQCGGCCTCATCHVYVDQDWVERLPAIEEMEEVMLELAMEPASNSRLSCQIIMDATIDGLRVELAPGAEI